MSSPPPSSPTGSPYKRPGVARHAAKSEPIVERDDEEPPAPPAIRRSARIMQVTLGVLALVAVGTIGAMGGWDRAGVSHEEPTAKVREPFVAGIWELTVETAAAGNELQGVKPDDEGNYLIEVDVVMKNTWNRTRAVFDRLVPTNVDGLVDKDPRRILMLRDGKLASYLQPDMPERIAWIWEVKAGTPVPKEVTVHLVGETIRPTSFAIVNSLISLDEPTATATVPVSDRGVRT